ncbi:MAG: CHASE2 domain-containing protein, partial [Spirulinaceae cyanobacterium]
AREQLHWLEEDFPCATWLPVIFQNIGENPLTWEELKGVNKSKVAKQVFSWRRGLQAVLLTSLIVTSCIVGLRSQSVFKPLELKAFDHLMQQRKDQGPDPRILVVGITDADQHLPEQQGKKPDSSISESALEELLTKLESYQPRAIGLMIFLDPPDYEPESPELKERFRKSQVLYGICNVDELGDGERGFLPPPTLPKKRLGFANGISDDDNVIRRSILFMDTPATSVCSASFSITLKLVEAYLEQESISHPVIKLPEHSNDSLYIGNTLIPNLRYNPGIYGNSDDDNWGYKSIINYRSYRSVLEVAETVTLEDILRDKVIPSKIRNKLILIGSNRSLPNNKYQTPYNQKMPGVILQAQMVSQLLSRVLNNQPLITFWPTWLDFIWISIWSSLGGILTLCLRSQFNLSVAVTISLASLYGACFYLLTQGFWVPLIPSVLALFVTAVVVLPIINLQKSRSI